MNCEEFRHQILIDPLSKDASFRDHARTCADCSHAAVEGLRFEETLREALSAEVSGAQESPAYRSVHSRSRARLALLFLPLFMVAVWLTVNDSLGPNIGGDPGAQVIDHIQAEAEHFGAEGMVSWTRLRELFAAMGADVEPGLGPVNFADRCVIGAGEGIHLVLPGERGAVTALFMPGEGMVGKREIVGAGLVGILIPAGFGLLAVVGVPGEPLEPVVRRLHAAVRWD